MVYGCNSAVVCGINGTFCDFMDADGPVFLYHKVFIGFDLEGSLCSSF